jgi:hypothetical protein
MKNNLTLSFLFYKIPTMETKENLEKLHKHLGTWEQVAKEIGITYQYICMIRNQGYKAGKHLDRIIADTVHLKGLV